MSYNWLANASKEGCILKEISAKIGGIFQEDCAAIYLNYGKQ